MSDRQPDLFDGAGFRSDYAVPAEVGRPRLTPGALDDDTLIATIPHVSQADCRGVAEEAGRRRLTGAVPALEALCRRFKGFGVGRAIPEQIAALRALAVIAGSASAEAVGRIIVEQIVQGPGLRVAAEVAAQTRAKLPPAVVASLLRHPDPEIRASACRCARSGAEVVALMIELLGDLNGSVATAAACSLGRMGRIEARSALALLMRRQPSVEVIDAAAGVADEECLVLLGRLARTRPELKDAALAALEAMDDPRAAQIAAAVRSFPS
jgi:hypothetical protein